MARRKFIEVFLVQKHSWFFNDEFDMQAGGEPIRTFRDRKRAEEFRDELERKARRGEAGEYPSNPFTMKGNDLSDQTSLGDAALLAGLEALGLEPPDGNRSYDWYAWWDANVEDFTPEQREGVWALCDQIAFYEVVAEDMLVNEGDEATA